MFGVPKLWLYGAAVLAVMALAVMIRTAGFNDGKLKAEKHWRGVVAKMQAEQVAKDQAALAKLAQITADQRAISAQADAQAQAGQVRIITRTRTLIEKVAANVPPDADPVVPNAFVRVLDEAAAGGDGGDAVPFAAGLTHEAASPVRLSQVGRAYVVNLGIGHQIRGVAKGCQDWLRAQGAVH